MPPAAKNITSSSRRSALKLSMTAMAAGVLAPLAAGAASPNQQDAELIRLCGEIVGIGDATRALCSVRLTFEEELAQMPEFRRLADEEDRLIEAIADLYPPRTLAGLRAMAVAAMAVTEIDKDGSLCLEPRGTAALVDMITQALAGGEIVA